MFIKGPTGFSELILTTWDILHCFTSHVGEHRTVRGLWKRQGIPCFCKIPTVQQSPEKEMPFVLRHIGDGRHVGDGTVFPVFFWIRNNWIGESQSDPRQPIRASFSETTEAVYRLMRGASRGLEQTRDILCFFFSACTSTSLEPSYVLRAIGADEDLAHSSIR